MLANRNKDINNYHKIKIINSNLYKKELISDFFEKKNKKIQFDDNIKITTIPNSDEDIYDPITNEFKQYESFIRKFTNNILLLNITVSIPIRLILLKSIDTFFFKVSNDNINSYKYINPADKSDIYLNTEYDTYELQNIDVFLERKDGLNIKIIYIKNSTDVNTLNLSEDEIILPFDLDNKRRVLSTINIDYQEMLENYEDGLKYIKFTDKTTGIIIGYNLVVY